MFGELLSAATRVVLTPVTVAVDVVNIGDTLEGHSLTAQNLEKAKEDVEDALGF